MQKILKYICKLTKRHYMICIYLGVEGQQSWCKTCGLKTLQKNSFSRKLKT